MTKLVLHQFTILSDDFSRMYIRLVRQHIYNSQDNFWAFSEARGIASLNLRAYLELRSMSFLVRLTVG